MPQKSATHPTITTLAKSRVIRRNICLNNCMKVSVVMPVYNAQDTVLQALDSLRAQTLPAAEIIIVNDGSTDGTLNLLHRQPDIELLDHSHRGIAAALNDGMAAASGDYIARMDADDICHHSRLELQASHLNVYSEIGVVGCLVAFGGNRVAQGGYAAYVDWINTLVSPEEIALSRFVESPFAHPSVMFRRGLFEQFGAYREGPFPEGYELWLRWMANGVQMAKVNEELLTWQDHPHRLSRTDARYDTEAFYRVKAEYLAMWLATNNPHHPDVMVWGAGRVTRKRAAMLEEFGIHITHYIDLKDRSVDQGIPVIRHSEIPAPDSCFILPMVASRGARREIDHFLTSKGHQAGHHFIHCT